jgi:hypothetical protein
MHTKKRKRSVTAQRVYTLLKNNPDLTTNEICRSIPDLTASAVQTAVSRMFLSGELKSRGKKYLPAMDGKMLPHRTYHVKYNVRPSRNLKKQPKPQPNGADELQKMIDDWIEEPAAPPMEAPKPVVANTTQPAWKPVTLTPTTEREVLVLRHLGDIYKVLDLMAGQQEALIEVLKDTLTDLAETKQELEEAQKPRGFWAKVKELF